MNKAAEREQWLATVQRIMPDDCWNWPWSLSAAGYGFLRRNGRTDYAHRVLYERLTGPIPIGYEIDHLCRNTRCVNPKHLEAVEPRTNKARGFGFSGVNLRKTHCPRGHEYTPENTVGRPSRPGRWCKTCKHLFDKAYRDKKHHAELAAAKRRGER